MPSRTAELEGVPQQVGQGGREELSIHLDHDPGRDAGDREQEAACLGLDHGRDLHLFHQVGEEHDLPAMQPRLEPHLGQRAVDEVPQREQVAPQHAARAAGEAHRARLEDVEGEHGIGQQVAELVGEEAQALGPAVAERHLAPAAVLGHGVRDGLVEATVQGAELVGRDRGLELQGQLRRRLADVSVVVHDLGDGEPGALQLAAVQRRAARDVLAARARRRALLAQERRDQLVQEEGNPVLQLRFRGPGGNPGRDLLPSARDDRVTVEGQEFMEHDCPVEEERNSATGDGGELAGGRGGFAGQPGQVDGEDASPAGQAAHADLAAAGLSTLREAMARPRPSPLRSALRCSNGRNNSSAWPGGRPPHSSSTSISTRPAAVAVSVLSTTCPLGRLNLKAFCSRLARAARDELPIHVDHDPRFDRSDRELEAPGVGFDRRRQLDFFHELGERDMLAS